MFILWRPSWIFWKIQKLLKINKKLIVNIETVSNLLKLSIWIEKRENKLYFKQIYVIIVKTTFEKVVAIGLIGTGLINIVFLDKFYEMSPNFVVQ